MDGELKYGQMAENMRESGQAIEQMEKDSFGTQMVTSTKETGKRIKQTAMDFTSTLMEQNI